MTDPGPAGVLQVLQISHDYAGPFQNICSQFAGAFRHAHVTTLYLRGQEDPSVVEATGGDRVLFLEQQEGSLRGIKISAIMQLARVFRQHRYDVVIAHRYKAIYLTGVMSYFFPIAVLLGVAHEHDVFKRTTRALFVTFFRKNIQLLAVSESVRKDIEKCCPSLATQNRVHTLGNAIDPATKSEFRGRDEVRKEMGIPEGVFCFGTVGRLVEKKDHKVLINAYARVANADNCLIVVGAGPREKELKSLAADLGIENQVTFLGKVPNAHRIYGAFDAFVFTSGLKEAFGLVLLEAMLAEVPIVCSSAAGPMEVIGDTGLIFEVGNVDDLSRQLKAIEMLDNNSRKALTDRALNRLSMNYTMSAFKEKLSALPLLKNYRNAM
jgi:glycosyltransferase involved in cell wall biosynthesis